MTFDSKLMGVINSVCSDPYWNIKDTESYLELFTKVNDRIRRPADSVVFSTIREIIRSDV